jgi:hypothetical protein
VAGGWFRILAIAAMLMAASCGDSARSELGMPPPVEPASYSLWLSASRVKAGDPVELVAALVNHDGTDATFGAFATIDRWDGKHWRPHRELLMCLNGWSCSGNPAAPGGPQNVPDVGLTAKQGTVGSPQRFTTQGLAPGWYRIGQRANEGIVAYAIFEIAPDALTIAPLDATDMPALSIIPVVASRDGAPIELSTLLPPREGSRSRTDLEEAVEGMDEIVTIEQWDGSAWQLIGEIALLDADGDPLIRRAELPPLPEGEYRLVRDGPNGAYAGRFWIAELGA